MAEIPKSTPLPPGSSGQTEPAAPVSPRWGLPVKVIIGLLLLVGAIALLVRFTAYFEILLIALIIAYLLQPICRFLSTHLHIGWRFSVAIVYILMAGLVVLMVALSGNSIVGQVQTLFNSLQFNLGAITSFLQEWSDRTIMIGPFTYTTPQLNITFLTDTITNALQPMLGTAGNVAGQVVGSVGSFLFHLVITYIVSFFLSSESGTSHSGLLELQIKGYEYDIQRLRLEFARIFNSFIRGSFTVVLTAIIVFSIVLGSFSVPYFFLLAVIAGLGRFIPYVGAWIGWVSFFIAALFQSPTPFGLMPGVYGLLLVGIALVIDTILDNVLMPKVMGDSLEVHPAAIMISALIGSQILGLLGIILAAPAFAAIQLGVRYSVRKLLDQDPWEGMSYYKRPKEPGLFKLLRILFTPILGWLARRWRALRRWWANTWHKTPPPPDNPPADQED